MEEDYSSTGHKKVGKQNNILPIWGNEATMNLNALVLTNIQSSTYFKVHLFKLKTYHEVVDEIYYQVKHMEPWEKGSRRTSGQTGMCGGVRGVGAGGIVSTAYCLLYKLYTLRLTRKQVNGLLNHGDSAFIRALGFMYLRYTQPPADLYDWYRDYLQDDEDIDVKAGGGQEMTIGQMVYQFLTKLDWFSTLFPRIPVPIQKQIERKLQQYCNEKNITLHQLAAPKVHVAIDSNIASHLTTAVQDYRSTSKDAENINKYRGEHDERLQYKTSTSSYKRSYSRSRTHSPQRRDKKEKERESRHRRKHKKHKRRLSRSCSRSRSRDRNAIRSNDDSSYPGRSSERDRYEREYRRYQTSNSRYERNYCIRATTLS